MKTKTIKKSLYFLFSLAFIMTCIIWNKTEYMAFPNITVEFDSNEQTVIVSNVPASDASGWPYELHGYLNYEGERVETFSYGSNGYPYHVPEKQAYIFTWSGKEFVLPCSGDYQFTTYLVKFVQGVPQEGPKTTITIHLTKKDESTNWGPGLPNTTVEVYDLNEMKGDDKNIVIEEEGYTWTINGQDIETVPEENISLAITANPENFQMDGVDEFFGDTIASKFSIEHDGEFGFKATLDYSVGTVYAGKYANLFYVVGDGTFEFIEGGLVDENGMISYTFTHASDYIIAITDEEYTGQELNPKVEEPVVDTETEEPEIEDTATTEPENTPSNHTGISPLLLIGILTILIIVAIAIFIKQKKK